MGAAKSLRLGEVVLNLFEIVNRRIRIPQRRALELPATDAGSNGRGTTARPADMALSASHTFVPGDNLLPALAAAAEAAAGSLRKGEAGLFQRAIGALPTGVSDLIFLLIRDLKERRVYSILGLVS
jgi:hypothetical protein